MKPFNAEGDFELPVESGGLRRQAIRGAGVTVFAQGVAFVVQMCSTVVLARILTPADFGLVTMATTFSILLVNCGQVGFPDAILQRESINRYLASNLFWIKLGIGLFLAAAFAASGSLIAKIYSEPRVAYIVVALSLTILIDSMSVLHLALLKRAMRFRAVSVNDIIGRAVSVIVATSLGIWGLGYWALVIGVVAYPLSVTIGAWSLCRWIPSRPRREPGTGAMVKFAAHVFGKYSIGYTTQNSDNLLVGWRFGSGALGFYKKAYDLFVLPFGLLQVYPVAVSTLSRLANDRAKYERYLLSGLSVLALVGMGFAGMLTLTGTDVVRVLLGPQWSMAGKIFILFGPGIGAQLIYSSHGMIHLSIGTTTRFLRWAIIEFFVTILLFVLALPWGPQGIAAAWTISYTVLFIPAFWFAGKPIGLGVGKVLGAVWRSMAAALIAGIVCTLVLRATSPLSSMPGAAGAMARIAMTSVAFGGLYLGALLCLHGGSAPLQQLIGLIREMLPFGRHTTAASVASAATSGNSGLAVHAASVTGESV